MSEKYPLKDFREMGVTLEVEVLEHTKDENRETYKLRATGKNVQNEGAIKQEAVIKEGVVFTVWRNPKYAAYSGWSVRDRIRNIVVTTPKSEMEISASEAAECLEHNGGDYYRKLGKNRPKELNLGSKIYYTEDGYIRGFGVVVDIREINHKCEYTDRQWGDGWYAVIPANTWHWIKPIPMKGFQGFRYFDDSDVEVIGRWRDPKPEVEAE